MAICSLLVAAFFISGSQGANQKDLPGNLTQYINGLHWDSAKSGVLLALEPERVYGNDDGPNTLVRFERKLVQVGSASVIAQSWTTILEDADLPSPYQALSEDEKITFLLATLNTSELRKLSSSGLSVKDLSGEQRLALMSLIPRPLSYLPAEVHGNGTSSSGESISLPEEERDKVRLQIRKGVNAFYSVNATQGNTKSFSSISSLDYRGPEGTAIVVSGQLFRHFGGPQFKGRIVDSTEKASQLSWRDPRLSGRINVPEPTKLGALVDLVRAQSGVEVYSDARISNLTIYSSGGSIILRDLLRGLSIAVGGCFRQVGPAFVLTSNLEGLASRETRLRLHQASSLTETQYRVSEWKSEVEKRHVLESLPFAADDPFQATSIPSSMFASDRDSLDQGWVLRSSLPSPIQDAIQVAEQRPARNRPGESPIAEFQGKARLATTCGYRFVLPDGRPMEFHRLGQRSASFSAVTSAGPKPLGFPFNIKEFKHGCAVSIRSNDPGVVRRLCEELKLSQVSEMWIDSENPSAIKAAVDSGLVTDLVIHPWWVLKGESCPDVDRNVLGKSGTNLNLSPTYRVDSISRRLETFRDSFSPGSSNLADHWARIKKLIPTKGIHKIILQDCEPSGYGKAFNGFAGGYSQTLVNGVLIYPGIQEMVPSIFDFGYSVENRLAFLRNYKMDPIDVLEPYQPRMGPIEPFFDDSMMVSGPFGIYPNVHSMQVSVNTIDKFKSWQTMKHSFVAPLMKDLIYRLSPLAESVFEEEGAVTRGMTLSPMRYVKNGPWDAEVNWDGFAFVGFVSFAPLNTEDSQGALVFAPQITQGFPFCFDLSEVPPDRFAVYLKYIFGAVSNGK